MTSHLSEYIRTTAASGLTTQEKFLLICIMEMEISEQPVDAASLSAYTRMGRRTISRLLGLLVDANLVQRASGRRSPNITISTSSPPSAPPPKPEKEGQSLASKVFRLYQKELGSRGLRKHRRLWPDTERAIVKRSRDSFEGLDDWREYFNRVKQCRFLFGENDRKWIADLEFLCRESTPRKVMEGAYDGTFRKGSTPNTKGELWT